MRGRSWAAALALALLCVLVLDVSPSAAFCGFFVSGADAKLSNDASMVVLMRDGTRTVLSMQNDYSGPPESFALVVPVPVVLQKDNVKTLSKSAFERIDALSAPRLVEYWEQDPCRQEQYDEHDNKEGGTGTRAKGEEGSMGSGNRFGSRVTIEAKFAVGEYEILILSAKDSVGLDGWLKEEHYKIPDGAEAVLRPYVAAGSKFFVAKVDVKKVQFEDGRLRLSPLRFHYDSDTFSLPVRLGLLNSPGTQDIVVNILARERHDVANYPNVAIPTNLDVDDSVRSAFPAFYAALFDRTLQKTPKAVVTEYAWDAGSCDPCPTPPLSESDLALFGGDTLPKNVVTTSNLTLTRLHARYTKDALGDDLVFRAAAPIEGGREGDTSRVMGKAVPASMNNFQARYAIRHRWTGPIRCRNPSRDEWGGPPNGNSRPLMSAKDVATAPRTGPVPLAALIRTNVPELDITAERTNELSPRTRALRAFAAGAAIGLFALLLLVVLRRRGHV